MPTTTIWEAKRNLKLGHFIMGKREEEAPTRTPANSAPEALFRHDPSLAEPQPVAPYAHVAPGVLMGWPPDAAVQTTLRQVPARLNAAGVGVEIDIRDCEQAGWLTLDFEVSWDYVLSRRMIGIGMDVACSPVTRMGLQLRLPQRDGTNQDIDGPVSILLPEMQRLNPMLTLPLAFAGDPLDAQPRIILWMSREPKTLYFERLFIL